MGEGSGAFPFLYCGMLQRRESRREETSLQSLRRWEARDPEQRGGAGCSVDRACMQRGSGECQVRVWEAMGSPT